MEYGLKGRGVEVRFPAEARDFFYSSVQTGSEAHPASYPVGTGGSFLGIKPPGREADRPPVSGVEVKNTWIYTFSPPYVFMA
jgi:hypothetical protein